MNRMYVELSNSNELAKVEESFKKAQEMKAEIFHVAITSDISQFCHCILHQDNMEIVIEGIGDVPVKISGVSMNIEASKITMKNITFVHCNMERPIIRAKFKESFTADKLYFYRNRAKLYPSSFFDLVSLSGLSPCAEVSLNNMVFLRNNVNAYLVEIKNVENIHLSNLTFSGNTVSRSIMMDSYKHAKLENIRAHTSGWNCFVVVNEGKLEFNDIELTGMKHAVLAMYPDISEDPQIIAENVYVQDLREYGMFTELLPEESFYTFYNFSIQPIDQLIEKHINQGK